MQELSRSEKDYLEAIYILKRQLESVRSIDVANYLGHSRPSVTKAVYNLCDKGYLVKRERRLLFTSAGEQAAERVVTRHCILAHMLKEVGIDEATAALDAQNLERVMSEEAITCTANLLQCQKRILGSCPIYVQSQTIAAGQLIHTSAPGV